MQNTNHTRGQRAGTIGGLIGITGAVLLGAIRTWNEDSSLSLETMLANLAFTISLCSPYVMALLAARIRDPAYRGGLLATSGIPAILSGFTALSGVSLILLPAAMIIFASTVMSLSNVSFRRIIPSFSIGVIAVILLVFGFFALFGIETDVEKCYNTATTTTCSSDIITSREALMSLAMTTVGMTVIIVTYLAQKRKARAIQ